jgi:hypothetical protein
MPTCRLDRVDKRCVLAGERVSLRLNAQGSGTAIGEAAGRLMTGAQTLNQVSSTHQVTNAAGASSVSTPSGTSAPYRVSLQQSVSSSSDLDGSAPPTVTAGYQYDPFGNATLITVSTPDGASTVTSNTYTNDTANWYLGRLAGASVTSTLP